MTSPRTLASRSAIIALLACALAVASAAPGVVEPTTGISSDVFDNIRSQGRRLSEIIRAGLPAPELRSALGGRIARARPEPTVRGRSLAAKKICEWNPCGADEEDCEDCDLKASVVYDFKPETPEGRTGFDILEPIVTCMDITLEEECKMKPSCIWYTDETPGYCDGDWNSINTAPVPASACTAAEKVDVTMTTLIAREAIACQKFQTESTCNAAQGLTCEWEDGMCSVGGLKFFLDLVTGSAKDLHTIVALGRQADACATKTTQSTCAAVTECAWNSGTSLCDVADATVKSIAGVETLSGVLSKWNTCQSKSQTDCTGDCKWANGNCELTSKKVSETLVDGMSDGAFKTFIAEGTYCTNSRASDRTTSQASLSSCYTSGGKYENGTSLPGDCVISDEIKHVVAGKPECFYFPGESWFQDIIKAPYPGYDKRCPNVMDRFMIKDEQCQKASTKAECGTGNYKECLWKEYPDDEGGNRCEFNGEYIWKLIVGDVDGDHLISIMSSCGKQSSEAACGAFEKDIDFFGLKYPDKSKVKTTLGFANIDSMDKSNAEELQKAVADAVGGDVKADEIAVKGVQFPVESKIELSTSKSEIDKDRAGFETKFKTGLAADLGVLPSDIVIKDIKESSRRRRGLLSSHVQVDFEVDGAPDAVRAKALASQVQSAGGLSSLKTNTGATPTIPAGTTPSYELRLDVEPVSSDPNGVAAKLNTATITMGGQTAKVETKAKVEKNTAVLYPPPPPPSPPPGASAANGAFSAAVAFLAAIAGVAFLA